ncbi:MAG: YihY/virulence factor BrkB family protein [Rhodospirillales bacterium]|nr:YihY/virulence factor BrkB family protein [Rhodospirillales bacterium]
MPAEEKTAPSSADPASEQSGAGAHGEEARHPGQIPKRGWKEVLLRVRNQVSSDHLSIVSAGVAFFALLAIFPGLTALVTIYGLVTDPVQVEPQLSPLRELLPGNAFDIIAQQTRQVAATAGGSLSLGLVLSLILALWSANTGTKSIITALNIAYDEKEERGFFALNLWSLTFTIIGIVFAILALVVVAAVPAAMAIFGTEDGLMQSVLLALRWVVMAGLMMLALAMLYRFAPSRREAKMQWVSVGAIAATLLWLLASVGFSLYVRHFGSYDKTFGALGAVVILLMWFYISTFVVCVGAELNAELERQTRKDSTVGPEKPIGERGAFAADNKAT